MSLLAAATQTIIAAASATAGVCSFLAYLYFMRRSEAHAARDEALALAETRREVIGDLRGHLAESQLRVRELSELLGDVKAELERRPPNVDLALTRIRNHLHGERPAA